MHERKISEALTTDDHFRQAGFKAFLVDYITEIDEGFNAARNVMITQRKLYKIY